MVSGEIGKARDLVPNLTLQMCTELVSTCDTDIVTTRLPCVEETYV